MWNALRALLLAVVLLPVGLLVAVFETLFGPANRRKKTGHVDSKLAQKRERRFLKGLGSSPAEFWNTPISYSETRIPKRTGGFRTLHIPSNDLKALQKKILKFIELHHGEKVHGCANAYIRGRGVVSNARPHIGCDVLIKLDLKDFFPSVTRKKVEKWIKFKSAPLELDDPDPGRLKQRLLDILCLDTGLPQGSPSSPLLSNLVLLDLDRSLSAYAKKYGAKYSRYADDITFSYVGENKNTVRKTIQSVERLAQANGFQLNRKRTKQRVLRKHQRQSICGVNLNSGKLTVSRMTRRELRAAKHKLALGQQASLTQSQLQGWDAYVKMVGNG